MTTLAANRSPDVLKPFVQISLIVHVTLCVLAILYAYFHGRESGWGGPPGGSITVGLVGNVPAIPLPAP